MRPPAVVLASLAVAALACAPKAADKPDTTAVQQAGTPTDAAAVRKAIEDAESRWAAGMTKGDTAAVMSIYADDAILMAPGMKRASGRAAVAQAFTGMMSGMTVPAASLQVDDVIVAGDYAIETGTYRMTEQPKTGKAMNDVGKFISIWKKQPDGSWKMTRDIFNSDGPTK